MDTGAYESHFSNSTVKVRQPVGGDSGGHIPNPMRLLLDIWARWAEERRIMRAVEALTLLDDHTLHDLGIPNRDEIEFTVRYCLAC
jgi:uncharacterized protein YjiS (DUF1127 family)